MIKVVGVKFRQTGKVYYFDPGELDIGDSTHVIVETARGVEYGEVAGPVKEIGEEELVSPLKPVLRAADEQDRKSVV